MLNYGYDPRLSEGAVKPPVFLTSTFVFNSAEEGRDFFDYVAGRREPPEGKSGGLIRRKAHLARSAGLDMRHRAAVNVTGDR